MFKKGLYFDKTEGAGDEPGQEPAADPKKEEPKWTPDLQAELDRRAAAIKKAAMEEGRKKAQAEFEAKQSKEAADAEKTRLESEGKFREAAELAEKAKKEAEDRAALAEAKAKDLELKDSFRSTARDLGYSFVNTQAEADAFAALDKQGIEDEDGMKKAFEKLVKERSYYFSEVEEPAGTDARERGKFQKNRKSEEQRKAEVSQRFNIRKPR